MRKPRRFALALFALALLAGCTAQTGSLPSEEPQSNWGEKEEPAVITPADRSLKTEYEVREGTHDATLATPSDVPSAYDYGSGVYYDFSYPDNTKKLPAPNGNETVLNTAPGPSKIQALYLWEDGNVPATTNFTESMTGYFDSYDFRPYVTAIPVRDGTEIKGAVVLMAGGAYAFRGNYTDTFPTAMHLRALGYQTFIVDYRLRPYTQQEGALDVARAVRFIRSNAEIYGIDPDAIAVMGYSAGGIQAGEFLLSFDETVNGTALDARPPHLLFSHLRK